MSSTTTRTIPFGRPWLNDDDRRAVAGVLEGHILTHGPQCDGFEAEFAAFMGNDAHAVSVSSCMAALHLACLHFGFGPGDEVVVPAQTHVATVHAVEWVGATPVFVDCDPATGNMTAAGIESALTERTKGVIVVHFVGIPCEMPAIVELARARGLTVVEDCALAVGARFDGTHVGLFGDAGCYSFYPVKHLTTGEGGMFVSRHEDVVAKVSRLRAFGVDRTHRERAVPGQYDVPELGLNYRMSELSAALGRSQLTRIGESLSRRRESFETIRAALDEVPDVRVLDGPGNSHYCLSAVLEDEGRDRLDCVRRLNEAGIGTSLYYPQPVPRMRYYQDKYGYDAATYRQAATISDRSIALPVGPHLTDVDAVYVAEQAQRILGAS